MAPDAEIIVLQYYNPFYVLDPATDTVVAALDASIAIAAASAGSRVANAFAIFNNPSPPPPATEFTDVCQLTLMCPGGDVHASDLGYVTIADIFLDASGYTRLTA